MGTLSLVPRVALTPLRAAGFVLALSDPGRSSADLPATTIDIAGTT